MELLHSMDTDNRRYVLKSSCGKWTSCLGFDVVAKRSARLAEWTGHTLQSKEPCTVAAYDEYLYLMEQAKEKCQLTKERCPVELCKELIGLEGARVEVTYRFDSGNTETRRFWVGKSTGWMPIHLEVARTDSDGGMPVLADCIDSVKVIRYR